MWALQNLLTMEYASRCCPKLSCLWTIVPPLVTALWCVRLIQVNKRPFKYFYQRLPTIFICWVNQTNNKVENLPRYVGAFSLLMVFDRMLGRHSTIRWWDEALVWKTRGLVGKGRGSKVIVSRDSPPLLG